jgi:FKBP-type peptidyl-prolyl cis-trans isomerase (trigger factor)
VQPKPELPDWSTLEVPAAEPEVPDELVDQAVQQLSRQPLISRRSMTVLRNRAMSSSSIS